MKARKDELLTQVGMYVSICTQLNSTLPHGSVIRYQRLCQTNMCFFNRTDKEETMYKYIAKTKDGQVVKGEVDAIYLYIVSSLSVLLKKHIFV